MIRLGFFRDFGFANLGFTLVWLVLVVSGMTVLLNYETRPGANPIQLVQWSEDSNLVRSANLPTVVIFTHPHCPCTRASISEFAQLVSICQNKAKYNVVAFDPGNAASDWRESDLVKSASAIPGVAVSWDKDGFEAKRFNVTTSGHVVLYDADGRLKFSGGITSSRGHEGSNFGRSQLANWLNKHPAVRAADRELLESPVYGCALVDGSETEHE